MGYNLAYLNTRDHEFILQEWLNVEQILAYPRFSKNFSMEDIKPILNTVLRFAKEVVEPTSDDGEANPARLVNGKVICPPSYGPLFFKIEEAGWGSSNADPSEDAVVLPQVILKIVHEILGAANPSFITYVQLTEGAAELIAHFASERVKNIFLDKMLNGKWSGTMAITEPGAGSDVGDLLSKAYPTEDPEIFKIKGQKIFITGADNNFTENIVNLFLARVEGARPGTAGLSLFVVPKYWVNEDGSLEPNDIEVTAVEHKMGLKGQCTCAISLGDNDGCRGWLLGKNPLENDGKGEGIAQMFKMMNYARLGVGFIGLFCVANAIYNARDYAKQRIQGRPANNPKGDRVAIINHADIKRTLLMGKAHIEAMRAMLCKTAFAVDVSQHDPDPVKRKEAKNLVDISTPLCKAYCTDEAWGLIAEAIQVFGGYGVCEEYPVARIARDVKVTSIYEGTNYIQAMDLLGRKMTMDNGVPFKNFVKEIYNFVENNKETEAFVTEFKVLEQALIALDKIIKKIDNFISKKQPEMLSLYARRILTAVSQVYCGMLILDQALLADRKAREIGHKHYDYNFYIGKVAAARYYLLNVVPNVMYIASVVENADTSALDIPIEALDY